MLIIFILMFLHNGFSDVLKIKTEGWIDGLDPATSHTLESQFISRNVYQTGLIFGDDGTLRSQVFKSWKFSQDGKNLDILLNPGIQFSNGEMLTGDHFLEMLKRTIKANVFQLIDTIVGVDEYRSGLSGEISGVSMVSPFHIKIRLKTAFSYRILEIFSDPRTSFLSEKNGQLYGSGRFEISQIDDRKKFIKLVSKDDSKKAFLIGPKITEPDISFVEPKKGEGLVAKSYFDNETYFYGINTRSQEFFKLTKRKKMADAVRTYAKANPLHFGIIADGGYIPKGLLGYKPITHSEEHVPDSFYTGNIKIHIIHDRFHRHASTFCSKLSEKGTICEVVKVKPRAFLSGIMSGSIEFFLMRLKPTLPSAIDLLSVFFPGNGVNLFYDTSHPIRDKMLKLTRSLLAISFRDKRKLQERLQEFDQFILSQYLAIPIGYGGIRKVYRRRNIALPTLTTLGPVGIRLENVKRK